MFIEGRSRIYVECIGIERGGFVFVLFEHFNGMNYEESGLLRRTVIIRVMKVRCARSFRGWFVFANFVGSGSTPFCLFSLMLTLI